MFKCKIVGCISTTVKKIEACNREYPYVEEEKESRETHVFNVFKAASVTLRLRHCTCDCSTEIIATT